MIPAPGQQFLGIQTKQKIPCQERHVERALLDYMNVVWGSDSRVKFWKQPNAGYFDNATKRFRKHESPYVLNGVPDIFIIIKGRFIGIETKNANGRQSQSQKDFQEHCEKAGSQYYLVKDIDEGMDLIDEIGKRYSVGLKVSRYGSIASHDRLFDR